MALPEKMGEHRDGTCGGQEGLEAAGDGTNKRRTTEGDDGVPWEGSWQPCEVGLIRELYRQRSRGGAHLWGQEAHCFSQLAGWF